MMAIIDQVKMLLEEGLYSNVVMLASLMKTASEQNSELLTGPEKYQLQVYYADALFEMQEYKNAEVIYRKALQVKKVLNKSKVKGPVPTQPPQSIPNDGLPSELNVRYRIYECNYHQKNYKEAIAVLQSIPAKQRKPKVNMALAKLYQRIGSERPAVTCFKEVLKQFPLALEAVLGLLSLAVKGTEVAALTINSLPNTNNIEWLTFWLKGHSYNASKDYAKAVSTFKSLETGSVLRENSSVLCCLAENHFLAGDLANALLVYKRVHSLDPLCLKGMDIYAYLLAREKRMDELMSLSFQLMSVSEQRAEPWIAMGYYYSANALRTSRAVYFAQKAYQIDPRNVQALLLKGSVLQHMSKTQEALLHFREAVRMAPFRFEAHQGLVDCYVKASRIREALTTASNACKVLSNSARSLTLFASVLAKDSLSVDKAKSMLEKALAQEPTYLEAVYLLAEVLGEEQRYTAAIDLLRRQLQQQSTCQLHQMLGDFLSLNNDLQEALDQYSVALGLDPTNKKVLEGIQKVEKVTDNVDLGQEDDMEALEESGEDVDYDASDTEVSWADNEWFS
ncbi:anaphase-promoting complex subunit 7-like [Asterias rubens]|uniref:anaphase-promoting complex subunit 7-like n=1 Tax=Asterias rubens TaxID=7604 RepID=UPI001455B331|nr:anaphase-promoting complex subunit 7-like [Asterias rubens]